MDNFVAWVNEQYSKLDDYKMMDFLLFYQWQDNLGKNMSTKGDCKMKDGKFEIGDRVRNISPDGDHRGMIGMICNPKNNFSTPNHYTWAEYGDGDKTCMPNNFYELISPLIITINSTKYQVLKEISGKSIWDNGKYSGCKDWCDGFEIFVRKFGFNSNPEVRGSATIDGLCDYLQLRPNHLQWLTDNKYLQKVEKKKVRKVVVIDDVEWIRSESKHIVPQANVSHLELPCGWDYFIGKPSMKMTLEWEEEE